MEETNEFYGKKEYRVFGSISACNQKYLAMKEDFAKYDDCNNGNVTVDLLAGELVVTMWNEAIDYPDYLMTFSSFLEWLNG